MSNLTADLAALFNELTSNSIPLTSPYSSMAPQIAVKLVIDEHGRRRVSQFDTRGIRRSRPFRSIASGNVQSTVIVLVDAAELLVCDTDEISLDLGTAREHPTEHANSRESLI